MASILKEIRIDSMKVFPDGETGSRVEWIVDVLPSELGPTLDGLMDRGAATMKQTFEAASRDNG